MTLDLDLGSKNPFRNRPDSFFESSLSPSSASPFDDPLPSGRPLSRNPFLDPVFAKQSQPLVSPGAMSSKSDRVKSLTAEELFVRSDHLGEGGIAPLGLPEDSEGLRFGLHDEITC